MGVPAGHPFFGNQYTDGGYIAGTFKYFPEIAEKVVDYSSKLVSHNIGADTTKIATSQKPKNLLPNTKGFNKYALFAVGIGLAAAVGGYFAYKFISRRNKAKKDAFEFIELRHVGACTHCGEPLIESTYVPKSEADSHDAYIICKNCGEKNFAWYPDDNDSSDKEPKLIRSCKKYAKMKTEIRKLLQGGNKMLSYGCGKGCGVDMEYIGDGDWKCPTCGKVIAFGELDEEADDNGEALNVWDAANIYLSRGFDEDYRFGYTHEELIKALDK